MLTNRLLMKSAVLSPVPPLFHDSFSDVSVVQISTRPADIGGNWTKQATGSVLTSGTGYCYTSSGFTSRYTTPAFPAVNKRLTVTFMFLVAGRSLLFNLHGVAGSNSTTIVQMAAGGNTVLYSYDVSATTYSAIKPSINIIYVGVLEMIGTSLTFTLYNEGAVVFTITRSLGNSGYATSGSLYSAIAAGSGTSYIYDVLLDQI